MGERSWTEPWPGWAPKWYGIALRAVLGLLGTLVGLGLVVLANFGATYKKSPPEWNGENVTVLLLGTATIVVGLAVATKPSRLSVAVTALTAVSIPIVGLII